jgi:hypothetical protein
MAHHHHASGGSEDEDQIRFEKFKKKEKHTLESGVREKPGLKPDDQDFTCAHCGFSVATTRGRAGVNNRNHCPRCLYSRHVDGEKPGDRAAVCKSRMEPVGLTTKQTLKRYRASEPGELMLVHRCSGCLKISINRLAADDDTWVVYKVFQRSQLCQADLRARLEGMDITMLESDALTTVYSQLFGWQSIVEEFKPGEEVSHLARVVIDS